MDERRAAISQKATGALYRAQPCRAAMIRLRRRHVRQSDGLVPWQACRYRLLCSGAPETNGPNQSTPLKPAQRNDAEQPACNRRGLGRYRATYQKVIDLGLGIDAIGRAPGEYQSEDE